jgi:hypothetical protein
MADELLELERMRADLPPADDTAMARARAPGAHGDRRAIRAAFPGARATTRRARPRWSSTGTEP